MTDEQICKQYFAAKGSRFNNADAAIIGPVLDSLSTEKKGPTPDEVVEAAREEACPIHPYFEWDDARAAGEHRRTQAREMCRAIVIQVIGGSGEIHATRGYQNVVVVSTDDEGQEVKERRYVPVQTVRQEPDLARQVLQEAGAQLRGWRERWAVYADVYEAYLSVFEAIDRTLPQRSK